MADGFEIRILGAADASAWVALRREMLKDSAWAFASSPGDDVGGDVARVLEMLGQSWQAIVGAFDDGRLVGAAGLYRDRHEKMAHRAWVWGMYVTPTRRSTGVGEHILERVIEEARSWGGVRALSLSASVRAESAIRLYERLGFMRWGVEPEVVCVDGAFYDEVHLRLALSPRP